MGETFSIVMPFLAVAVVIACAYWATRWLAKAQGFRTAGRHIQVLERAMLTKDSCIALIRVGAKIYLASVSAGKVELIREVDKQELSDHDTRRSGGDFFHMLNKSMGNGKQKMLGQQNETEQDGAAHD